MQQLNKLLMMSFIAIAAIGCGKEQETTSQESAASTTEVVSEEAEQQAVDAIAPAELIAEASEADNVVDEDINDALEQAATASSKYIDKAEALGSMKKSDLMGGEWREGTVQYIEVEGGFFGIVTKNGGKFLPMNMDKSAQKHGSIIKFKGVVLKDMHTIQQWGTPIKLSEVKVIKEGSSVKPGLL